MTLRTRNPLILLISVLVGVVIGELLHLDDGVQALGRWAERRTRRDGEPGRVSLAFVTTSLLFCVGPLTILGSFLDGTRDDVTVLAFLVHAGLSEPETAELTAAGGIIVLGIALGLLDLKVIKVANFLPALMVAPLLAGALQAVGAV